MGQLLIVSDSTFKSYKRMAIPDPQKTSLILIRRYRVRRPMRQD